MVPPQTYTRANHCSWGLANKIGNRPPTTAFSLCKTRFGNTQLVKSCHGGGSCDKWANHLVPLAHGAFQAANQISALFDDHDCRVGKYHQSRETAPYMQLNQESSSSPAAQTSTLTGLDNCNIKSVCRYHKSTWSPEKIHGKVRRNPMT